MRVCLFGHYALGEGYPVNRYLAEGLRRAGVHVEACREDFWGGFLHSALKGAGPLRMAGLACRWLRSCLRLARRYRRVADHDCVVVGYPGYLEAPLARLLNLCRRRPVVLVSFISLYDTVVADRGAVAAASWRARLLWCVDRMAFACADRVLVDTEAQIDCYARLFRLPASKFLRSYVGHELGEGEEPPPAGGQFRVLFFGTYVPLHGVEVIVEAATLLRREAAIVFTLVGAGQQYRDVRRQADEARLDNVRFVDTWMGPAQLTDEVRRAHVCLGIFGTTAKAGRVIPYKVFGALAHGRPVITRDSPAIRELLVDGESVVLCPPGDARSLADAILELCADPALAARIGAGGRLAYESQAAPEAVGRHLRLELERLVAA